MYMAEQRIYLMWAPHFSGFLQVAVQLPCSLRAHYVVTWNCTVQHVEPWSTMIRLMTVWHQRFDLNILFAYLVACSQSFVMGLFYKDLGCYGCHAQKLFLTRRQGAYWSMLLSADREASWEIWKSTILQGHHHWWSCHQVCIYITPRFCKFMYVQVFLVHNYLKLLVHMGLIFTFLAQRRVWCMYTILLPLDMFLARLNWHPDCHLNGAGDYC